MVQKVIKIGSSAGVTIPKKQLKELGISIGDDVKVSIAPVTTGKHQKLLKDLDGFMKTYEKDLKNLTSR